jgi:hypothetical protein
MFQKCPKWKDSEELFGCYARITSNDTNESSDTTTQDGGGRHTDDTSEPDSAVFHSNTSLALHIIAFLFFVLKIN